MQLQIFSIPGIAAWEPYQLGCMSSLGRLHVAVPNAEPALGCLHQIRCDLFGGVCPKITIHRCTSGVQSRLNANGSDEHETSCKCEISREHGISCKCKISGEHEFSCKMRNQQQSSVHSWPRIRKSGSSSDYFAEHKSNTGSEIQRSKTQPKTHNNQESGCGFIHFAN